MAHLNFRRPGAHGPKVLQPGDLAPMAPVTDRELALAAVLIRELRGVEKRELHPEIV